MDYYRTFQSSTTKVKDAGALKKEFPVKKFLLISLSLLIVIGTIVTTVIMLGEDNYIYHLQSHGYIGLFFVSIIAGSPMPVPTFSVLLVIALGGISNPWLVGLIAGLGFAGGRIIYYLSARGSCQILKIGKITSPTFRKYSKIADGFLTKIRAEEILDYLNRHSIAAIFFVSLFPNPFLVPALLISGAKKISFYRVFLACWAGKTILFLLLAFAGYFGWHYWR